MTIQAAVFRIFAPENKKTLESFKIIAFTHKTLDLKEIGKFHVEDTVLGDRLNAVKALGISEIMFLSTCNRVEFLLNTAFVVDETFISKIFTAFRPDWSSETVSWAVSKAIIFNGEDALNHLFQVASSIDSLVVGEREIITQVRNAYEKCDKLGSTGDLIRLIVKHTIETAKEVYTKTSIANKPVSVVSLAYRKLKDLNVKLDARFIIVGAGQTNILMSKFLKKHGFKNFTIFNRSIENAQKLAGELNGEAHALSELSSYTKGFDVILTCTAASEHIITKEIYSTLTGDDKSRKVIIDLSVPNDLDPELVKEYNISLIDVSTLQAIANENLQERKKELTSCHEIISIKQDEFKKALKERKVEIAMSDVPRKVKEIKDTAMNAVFAKEIESLDPHSKDILDKVLAYMEKKYISVPMKMAKDILIEKN